MPPTLKIVRSPRKDADANVRFNSPGLLQDPESIASASFVGDLTIFNVGGNKYRIAAFVHYAKQIVYIKRIGTHKEYDRWDL